jgi:hypothetical protein
LITRTKNGMDIVKFHKSKTSISIACIGTMLHTSDFTSLCINCDTVITAIVDSKGSQPLYPQFLLNFIKLINNPEFDKWHHKDCMPFLHRHIYTFLKRIFNLFAKFATNFGNVNVVTEGFPLTNLNIKPLQKAMNVMRALVDLLNLSQSTNSPTTNISSMVMRYTASPWSNTNVCIPAAATLSNTPYPKEAAEKPHCDNRSPVSPNEKAKAASNDCLKEPCCSVANKSSK